MLKRVLSVVLVLVSGLAVMVSTRPERLKVQRSVEMSAAPDVVFAQLNDFHHWAAWSPWDQKDPSMKRTYPGSPVGIGAGYSWESSSQGEGKLTIVQSTPPNMLTVQVESLRSRDTSGTMTFRVTSSDSRDSTVTWSLTLDNSLTSRGLSLFSNLGATLDEDFRTGLAELKRVSEALSKPNPAKPESASVAPQSSPPADFTSQHR